MNSNFMPMLSVVTPYAGSATLTHFLRSLTWQTLSTDLFELVLVEDGNHGCEQMLDSFALPFAFRVMTLNRPVGFVGHTAGLCRNLGAHHARGPMLLFVDSDCILHPDCLRSHLEFIGKDGGLAV